jgi:hypothetical protein
MPYLSSNSKTTIEMVLGLSLNFSILPEELLTSMVYMGVEITAWSGIYSDGMRVSAATCIPH